MCKFLKKPTEKRRENGQSKIRQENTHSLISEIRIIWQSLMEAMRPIPAGFIFRSFRKMAEIEKCVSTPYVAAPDVRVLPIRRN